MKKLFILLITISAFVLGISSCSNDLHDGGVDLSSPKCDIIGDMDAVGVHIEDGIYTFTYSNGMTAWGGGNGTLNYKVRPNATWDGSEVGGENIIAGTVPSHLEVTKSSDGNAVIKGLKDGGEYTLHFVSSGANLELSIDADDATPNYTYIEGFYLLSKEINGNDIGNAGKQVLVNGTQTGSDIIYTISYLPKTGQKTIGFEISNADKSVRYRIDADDKNAKQVIPDSGEEVKLAMNPKNGKNVEIAKCLPMQAQVFITVRTTAVTTDAEGNTQGGDIYVSATTGDDITPAEILDATDLAGSPMGEGLKHKDGEPGVFEFVYNDSNHTWGEQEGEAFFKVRKNGDWDTTAYGDPLIIEGELPEGVEVVSNKGTKEEQQNAKITGLKDKQGYRWTFTVSKDDPESLVLDIAEIEVKPIEIPSTAVLNGDMGEIARNAGDSCSFTVLFDDAKHDWSTTSGTWAFCLMSEAGNWDNGVYKGSSFTEGSLPKGATLSVLSDSNGGITGLVSGKTYTWTFKGSELDPTKIVLDIAEANE